MGIRSRKRRGRFGPRRCEVCAALDPTDVCVVCGASQAAAKAVKKKYSSLFSDIIKPGDTVDDMVAAMKRLPIHESNCRLHEQSEELWALTHAAFQDRMLKQYQVGRRANAKSTALVMAPVLIPASAIACSAACTAAVYCLNRWQLSPLSAVGIGGLGFILVFTLLMYCCEVLGNRLGLRSSDDGVPLAISSAVMERCSEPWYSSVEPWAFVVSVAIGVATTLTVML